MYNKTHKMTQEQLRMQMLAGIITEGQYKTTLNEGLTSSLLNQYKDKTGPQGLIISKLLTLEEVLTQLKKEQSSNPDPNVTVESIIDMVLETFNEIREI
jgi:hypothetical protein